MATTTLGTIEVPTPLITNLSGQPFAPVYDRAVRDGNILALWHVLWGEGGEPTHCLYGTETEAEACVAAVTAHVTARYEGDGLRVVIADNRGPEYYREYRRDINARTGQFTSITCIRLRLHTLDDERQRWGAALARVHAQEVALERHNANPALVRAYGQRDPALAVEVWGVTEEGTTTFLGVATSLSEMRDMASGEGFAAYAAVGV